MQYQLNISGIHYDLLIKHLYPGDGLEAVAVALCGRLANEDVHKLLVQKVVLIPYSECDRTPDFIAWKTERLSHLMEEVLKYNYAILKIHSHPGGYEQFSSLDDDSDSRLFSSVFGWTNGDYPHASSIMLPDGRIFGRIFKVDLTTEAIEKVNVVSDEMKIWTYSRSRPSEIEVGKRTVQAFGEGTFNLLKQLTVGVVGCSGTGSPVIEQLVRLGVGGLVIVDPDKVEFKNLNRILNTKRGDAIRSRQKTTVLKEAITGFDLGTQVEEFPKNLYDDVAFRPITSYPILT